MNKNTYKKTMDYVVKTSMKVLGISKQDAELRTKALLKSGIMEGGSPEDEETQKKIDMFMQGIGRPVKYFALYTEPNPDGLGLLYGIQCVRDEGFSFVLKYKGEKMWLKDKAEAERALQMFDEYNKCDPEAIADFY